MIRLTDEQAETVIQALSAVARDEMRFKAWDVMNAAIQAKRRKSRSKLPEMPESMREVWISRSEHVCSD